MTAQAEERERQALELVHEGQALMRMGQLEQALVKQQAAEAILRPLALERPGERRYTYQLASLLYAKASGLGATGRLTEALAALHESERGYTELGEAGIMETGHVRADVHSRVGRLEAARHRGASAAIAIDRAIESYLRLLSRPQAKPREFDPRLAELTIAPPARWSGVEGQPFVRSGPALRRSTVFSLVNGLSVWCHMH